MNNIEIPLLRRSDKKVNRKDVGLILPVMSQ